MTSHVPVVLLHAYPLNPGMFEPLLAAWRPERAVLTPAICGFDGMPPVGPVDLDTVADELVQHLDDEGITKAVVGGVSMGGYVALAFARKYPERLAGLLLIDTKASADTPEAAAVRLAVADSIATAGTASLLPMVNNLLSPRTREEDDELVAHVESWLLAAPAAAVSWAQRAMAARRAADDLLVDLRVPVLVIVGEDDTMSPVSEGRRMAELAPFGEIAIVSDAGHLAVVEQPEACAGVIEDWFARREVG